MSQGKKAMGKSVSGKTGNPSAFQQFQPHPAMRMFLHAISLLVLAVSVFPWSVPLVLTEDHPAVFWIVGVGVHVATLLIAFWILIWVPRYYESIVYGIDEEWLYAEGGVIWKRRARLPISRVQLVNITQGPWQRRHGLANVSVYTAATGQTTAELTFMNVANAEGIRDHILELVRQQRTDLAGLGDQAPLRSAGQAKAGVAGGGPVSADQRTSELSELLTSLLTEVRSIRESLSKGR